MSESPEDQKDIPNESSLQQKENVGKDAGALEKILADDDIGEAILPPELLKAMEEMPSDVRKVVSSTIIHAMAMPSRGGIPPDPELSKQRDKHQFEIAMKGIEATQVDRSDARAVNMSKFKIIAGISSGVILCLVLLSVLAMYNGNTAFIIELLKAVAFILGGFGGGVAYSKSQPK